MEIKQAKVKKQKNLNKIKYKKDYDDSENHLQSNDVEYLKVKLDRENA
jgi:hypothetical protein